MNFEEKICQIHNAIASQSTNITTSRIDKSKDIIMRILHSYRHKAFNKEFLQIAHIKNPLCLALTQNLIDVADIYIINAFVRNLTTYSINLEYIKNNYTSLSYTLGNCESDVNILT